MRLGSTQTFMKTILTIVVLSVLTSDPGFAQKKPVKKPAQRPRTTTTRPAEQKPQSRLAGTPVTVVTKNGEQQKGTVVDLTTFSIRIRAGALESSISLDNVESLSFGTATPPASRPAATPTAALPAGFIDDAETAITAFQSMSNATKAGTDYSDYGRLLGDLRGVAERFIDKYSTAENPTAFRVVALLSGALTDYTWARTIWTMKLGRTSDGTVRENDSPVIADTLSIYPDLKAAAGSGGRYAGDKLTAGLWVKASDKVERARTLLPAG